MLSTANNMGQANRGEMVMVSAWMRLAITVVALSDVIIGVI